MSGLLDRLTGTNSYSVEEQDRIRQLRADFNGVIQTYQKRALEEKEKGSLSPEGAEAILKRNVEAQEWLAAHPTARILELQAEKDAYTQDINNVLETDIPKANFRSFYLGLRYLAGVDDSRLTKSLKETLLKEADQLESWYNKNKDSLNKIQLEQQTNDSQTRILQSVEDANFRSVLKVDLEGLKNKSPQDWTDVITAAAKNEEIIQQGEFRWSDIWDAFVDQLKKIPFLIFFIIAFFVGSLAANSVIYRPAIYRVLYFFYGALFSPILAFYFLIQRIRCGPFPLYGVLPVLESSPEKEETYGIILYLLRSLVTYFPDENISRWAGEYDTCLAQYDQGKAT